MGYLRVYLGNALKTQIELSNERLTIGRAEGNDLVLNDPGVSSHHATIIRDGSKYIIEDNDSTNGVFVNHHRIKKTELKYWDEIQIYNHVLKFMALTSRESGEDPELQGQDRDKNVNRTRVVDLSEEGLQALLRKHRKKSMYVVLYHSDGTETRFPLPQETKFTIGRAKGCDIRTGGWFAPQIAAKLTRDKQGCHLNPYPRGKVRLNGTRLQESKKLGDGDDIKARNLTLRFFHRVKEGE